MTVSDACTNPDCEPHRLARLGRILERMLVDGEGHLSLQTSGYVLRYNSWVHLEPHQMTDVRRVLAKKKKEKETDGYHSAH